MNVEELFFEIGTILIIAAAFSMFAYRFRQPLIIAYIITGVIAGPSILALARNPEIFEVMSQIGIAFLLFTVGLGLNWRMLKDVGGVSLATGVGQVLMTSVLGFLVGILLGFDAITSIYLSVAFAFSSTIIVVKLLMDKEELDTLHGRISVGFLLVQDFIAMIILLALTAVKSGASLEQIVSFSLIKVFALVPVFWLLSTKVLPSILSYVAKSQELLFVFAVAWCFLVAGLLVLLGFGVELGALIAGVSLSGSIYQREINARVRPLRDFFLIIFFIVLGTRLGIPDLADIALPAVIFSLFVLISNPLVVIFIMKLLGYHPRTGFLFGTAIAQVSEFSFIVIAAGIATGHLESSVLALATAVGILTITASSYLIENNERLYQRLSPIFNSYKPKHTLAEEELVGYSKKKVLLFGYHDTGTELLASVRKLKQPYMVVDFDPAVVRHLSEQGIPNAYGDAGDQAFLEEIGAEKARLVISTIPDTTISTALLTYLRNKKFTGTVVVSVHTQAEAELAYKLDATYVIVPSVLSGKKFAEFLRLHKSSRKSWSNLKNTSLRFVKSRG